MALGRRYDTSPIGTGKNWVTEADPVEGLGAFVHAVVHALMRDGHPEGEAIAIAEGVMKRWAAGIGSGGPHNKTGKVSAKTQAKATAAVAHWEALKAKAHAMNGHDKRGMRQLPAPGVPVTEAGSSASALIPVGIPPAQAKAVQKKMGGGQDPDVAHAFRGNDLSKCSVCGQPLSSAIHRTTTKTGSVDVVPPVARQAKGLLSRASEVENIARARATRPAALGAIQELGVRWKYNPKQPRGHHGKWSGPSVPAPEIQSKAHLAFLKVWGPSPELHDFVKKHVDANPNVTAAAVEKKLHAAGYTNHTYSHILTTVKQVKAENAAQLDKEITKEYEAKAAPGTDPWAATPSGPKIGGPGTGFNGSGHVGFGGTEALWKQSPDSAHAVKWFKPGDKVYAYTYTGNKLVAGTVDHVTSKKEIGSELVQGTVHIKVPGDTKVHAFNATRVAHQDVIDSLDAKALKMHADASSFNGVKKAFNQAALEKGKPALPELPKPAPAPGPELPPPAPPFPQKTDHELELMSGAQLAAHLSEATKALGPHHPYVATVFHHISPEFTAPEIDTEPPDVSVPGKPEYAKGSLEGAVAAVLADDPNATSAAVQKALKQQGFQDTSYSRILKVVKEIKTGQHISGTTGPAQTGALVPEIPQVVALDKEHLFAAAPQQAPAVEGARKLEKLFPQHKSYYGEVTEGTKRAQKRKISADIAKRLTAKVGDKYDMQLLKLARPGSNNIAPEGRYLSVTTDGILQVSGYQSKGAHLWGTPEATVLVRRAGVSKLVAGWASTSNDQRPASLVMQEAVSGELGLHDTSQWANLDSLTKGEMAKLMGDGTYELCKVVARCMYEATQQELKRAGITEVVLYRGVKPDGMTPAGGYHDLIRAAAAPKGPGKVATVKLRPISSWAFRRNTALIFAGGLGSGGVFGASVPANRIFSTAMTGFGCLNEHEVVVLGGEDKVLVG